MKTELYKSIKAIDIRSLIEDDKEELLRIFMVTKNVLIRNHIAIVFADLHYDKAVPYIIKKINEKSTFNNNGTLVYSLGDFDLKKYFIPLIRIISEQEYEARLTAYGIVQDLAPSIPVTIKRKALKILEERRLELEHAATDKGENSSLHFVEQTEKMLLKLSRDGRFKKQ
jgi:hypothetical protein